MRVDLWNDNHDRFLIRGRKEGAPLTLCEGIERIELLNTKGSTESALGGQSRLWRGEVVKQS